jgi:hypothetical protein
MRVTFLVPVQAASKESFAAHGRIMEPLWLQVKNKFIKNHKAIDSGVRSEFVKWLDDLISAKFKSRRAFIREVVPASQEDSAQAYLGQVMAGKKPPPLEYIDKWADALGIKGTERQRFIHLAITAHIPREFQAVFVKILDDWARQKAKVEELQRRLDSLD